jgi:uncharacterized membrane protein
VTASSTEPRRPLGLAIFLIVTGALGFYAAFDLTIERIQTLIDPSYSPTCNISPLVTCGPNMASWQGSLFGFPNPIIGVACFIAPIVVGMGILAGARYARWFWLLFNLGIALALVFVIWLIVQSIYVLGTLCPYCMLTWSVVIPMFFYVTAYNLKEGRFGRLGGFQDAVRVFYPWTWTLVLLSYLAIVLIAQLRLDAITTILLYS